MVVNFCIFIFARRVTIMLRLISQPNKTTGVTFNLSFSFEYSPMMAT